MSENNENSINLVDFLKQFESDWRDRLGPLGDALSRDLRLLVNVIIAEVDIIVDERIAQTVSSWARTDSDELIPLDKLDKEGILKLIGNPEFISNGELLEAMKLRLAPDS